jgi:hypothetical protein
MMVVVLYDCVLLCGTYVFDHVLSFEHGGLKLELIRRHTQIPTHSTDTLRLEWKGVVHETLKD